MITRRQFLINSLIITGATLIPDIGFKRSISGIINPVCIYVNTCGPDNVFLHMGFLHNLTDKHCKIKGIRISKMRIPDIDIFTEDDLIYHIDNISGRNQSEHILPSNTVELEFIYNRQIFNCVPGVQFLL